MKLFTTTVASFEKIEKTDFGYRYTINENDYKKAICLECDSKLIDIDTLEEYYLLKREKSGTLSKEEFGNIKLNVRYALKNEPLLSQNFTIPVALKAKKALSRAKLKQKTLKR